MTTYNLKIVSQTNALAVIIIMSGIFLGTAILFIPPGTTKPFGLLILFSATSVYLLWQKFVTGRTEWTIDDNEITIIWIKTFVLADCKNLKIKWPEIEDINARFDLHYRDLEIKLLNGDSIVFYHDNLVTKDDFESLKTALHQTLNKKKSERGHEQNTLNDNSRSNLCM